MFCIITYASLFAFALTYFIHHLLMAGIFWSGKIICCSPQNESRKREWRKRKKNKEKGKREKEKEPKKKKK